jgi:hypothetical protein
MSQPFLQIKLNANRKTACERHDRIPAHDHTSEFIEPGIKIREPSCT